MDSDGLLSTLALLAPLRVKGGKPLADLEGKALPSFACEKVRYVRLRNTRRLSNLVLSHAGTHERGDDVFPHAQTIAFAVACGNSTGLFDDSRCVCTMAGMEIEEIRRQNLRYWIDTDPHSQGNVTAWCNYYSQFVDDDEASLTPSYIRQLAPKNGKPQRHIGEKSARRLERIGGKPHGWMDVDRSKTTDEKLAQHEGETMAYDDALALRDLRRIPLVGEVKGGADGYLEELQYPVGHGDGYVLWPTTDNSAYALRVRGDSMHPRYRAGEFVIVEPSKEPPVGEDVVVIFHDGRKMLKVLNWVRDGEVQLLSINNGFAPLTVSASDIAAMHYAAGRAPRTALLKI